jgi:phosphohistidine phosphatase
MRQIYLIRHAKSSWNHSGLADFDRPLNKRGERDAPLMGRKLAELGCKPDRIISSPATRALTTAKTVAQAIGYPVSDVDANHSIYAASVNELIMLISNLSESYRDVILVGHNPEMTNLSNHLTDEYIDHVPTCGIIHIELAIDEWHEIGRRSGTQLFFITPKMLTLDS